MPSAEWHRYCHIELPQLVPKMLGGGGEPRGWAELSPALLPLLQARPGAPSAASGRVLGLLFIWEL